MQYLPLALAAALVTVPPAVAAAEEGFFQRKAEGWFWYEVEPEPIEEADQLPPPPAPAPVANPAPAENPEPASPPPPAVLSAAWVRENLPKYLDRAWDDPTLENVRAYLYLQRYAMDKSEQFADVGQLAVLGDPYLDEAARRPFGSFASDNLDRIAGANKTNLVAKVADQAGIFFFFSSDCPQCEVQAPVLKMLQNADGVTVLPISVDGGPLSVGTFPDYRVDAGHSEYLGIQTLPALFLATPDGRFAPLGQGTFSLPELRHRFLVAALREGLITESEFNRTRPVLNKEYSLADVLGAESVPKDLMSQATKEKGFVDPALLMQHINTLIRRQQ